MYLLRQVAASDGTDRGRATLADYYSEKGETPGRWIGNGLAALGQPIGRDHDHPTVIELWSVPEGSEVSEEQMKALFGEGLHPNADKITKHLSGIGLGKAGCHAAAKLGRPFRVMENENEYLRRMRSAYAEYNATLGLGANAPIEPEVRADIRTAVGRAMFTETYGREPANDRELTGFLARQTRCQTTAVAGYDLTFTPVKSFSALWALAPLSVSEKLLECHHRAVADALTFIENEACFARMGANGIAQLDTTGLIAAMFDHRDSRAGDPNPHTHVPISNKVQAIGPDGIPRWLALDGEPLHKAVVAASELYNTQLEAYSIELGVDWAAADTKPGKRPVREIVGIPTELTDLWSSRGAAIDHRVGELAKAFQTEHHREPSAVEMIALSQQANLETRQSKHAPRSLAEQRQTWRTEAAQVLGSQQAVDAAITKILAPAATRQKHLVTDDWVAEQAAAVITKVSAARSTWGINHVRAEAQRTLRYTDHQGDQTVAQRIIDTARNVYSVARTSHADTDMGEPGALRRRDGSSIYTRHDSTVYTSEEILAAERRILAAAALAGGRVVDDDSIDTALAERLALDGVELNDGQATLLRDMATSGARCQLALAPAGSGKTTAAAPLASAWITSGGTVIGLAPTAAAAEVLAADLGAPTDTIDKLVQLAGLGGGPPPAPDDPARAWFDSIDARTLIIVDEAGMASTAGLDAVITHALAKGASIRLIGDDKQLASVSAGGVLRDIAEEHGALALADVVRFTDPLTGAAEGAASLALREGDPTAIAFYLDHDRVHVGPDAAVTDMAYQAWADALAGGRDALMIAPTNDLVADLNQRARLDRLRREEPSENTRTVTLSDGLQASVGDWIITRNNARWLHIPGGGWVKNGHRWVIRDIAANGTVSVSRLTGSNTESVVRLPARYVASDTTLGYARTINGAQGWTARHECHVVGTEGLPPADRRGHHDRDPAPHRRAGLRTHRRPHRERPVQPGRPRRRHVPRRPHSRCRNARRPGRHGRYRRRRPPGAPRAHRMRSVARAAPRPGAAGTRWPRPDRHPHRGRPRLVGRCHRRRRRARQSPAPTGRQCPGRARSAALAARHPQRPGRRSPVGTVPGPQSHAGHRSGRPDSPHRTVLDRGDRTTVGAGPVLRQPHPAHGRDRGVPRRPQRRDGRLAGHRAQATRHPLRRLPAAHHQPPRQVEAPRPPRRGALAHPGRQHRPDHHRRPVLAAAGHPPRRRRPRRRRHTRAPRGCDGHPRGAAR
jgi:conjugative relaxase-like TrwC/TraI family protein